jgi:hypothetical protein
MKNEKDFFSQNDGSEHSYQNGKVNRCCILGNLSAAFFYFIRNALYELYLMNTIR